MKGYECIKILIAIRLSRLKGVRMYMEDVALKRKSVFPLLKTINVCGEREKKTRTKKVSTFRLSLIIWLILFRTQDPLVFASYFRKR